MILSLLCVFSVSVTLNGGFTKAGSIHQPGLDKANNGNLLESTSTIPTLVTNISFHPNQTSLQHDTDQTIITANGTVPGANGTVPGDEPKINTTPSVPTTKATVPGANGTVPSDEPKINTTTSVPTMKDTETTTVTPVTKSIVTTTVQPVTKSTVTTTVQPVTKSTVTTTIPPITKSTVTTTVPPVTSSTIAPSPKSTTPEIKPGSTTTVPVFSTNATPVKDRHFDGPSFIGGIVLSLGTMAIGLVALKFYKARTEINYHTL